MLLNNFSENQFDLFINATMSPDKQLGKQKDVPNGTVIDVCQIYQAEVPRTATGEIAVATSLVDSNGVTYQTLSDFVAKFFQNVAAMKDPTTWPENPIRIMTEWKEGKKGSWLSVKLVK